MVVGSNSTAGKAFKDVWVAKEGQLAKHYGEALWTPAPFPDGLKDVLIVAADVGCHPMSDAVWALPWSVLSCVHRCWDMP